MATSRTAKRYEKNKGYLFNDNNFLDMATTPYEAALNRNDANDRLRQLQTDNDKVQARIARRHVRLGEGKNTKDKARQLSRLISLAEEKAGRNGQMNPSETDMARINRAFKAAGMANVGG